MPINHIFKASNDLMYKISLVKLNKFFNSYFLRLITCKNKSVKMYKILKKFVKLFYFILYDS